jgi:hypothetical protein
MGFGYYGQVFNFSKLQKLIFQKAFHNFDLLTIIILKIASF